MFNEGNTVEALVCDCLSGPIRSGDSTGVGESGANDGRQSLGWRYVPTAEMPRRPEDVLVEPWVREALIRLNPEIAAHPDRADDVLYKLRAIIMGVRSDGVVKANEEFSAWLTGERSMPFGKNGEHVTIQLIDFTLQKNDYVVTRQYTFRAGATEKRADIVLLVNGIPIVVIEAKTPVRACQSWFDGATQVHEDYERNVPELFVPNLLSVAT